VRERERERERERRGSVDELRTPLIGVTLEKLMLSHLDKFSAF